jgi:energy-coupling factor transporter ATP-binding protein EcfA2
MNKQSKDNPFPGLKSFQFEDHALFFGRETQVESLREKLFKSGFLAITGAAGSGKSSLSKAGLIPAIIKASANSANKCLFIPFNPGMNPLRSLAEALTSNIPISKEGIKLTVKQVEQILLDDPKQILTLTKDIEAKHHLLIFIDQFEEVFRYAQPSGAGKEVSLDTKSFIQCLVELTVDKQNKTYVVLTMQSTYLEDCTQFEGFIELINDGSYLIPKMSQPDIRNSIIKPALYYGVTISEELVDQLMQDLEHFSDPLPVLQHALMRTWAHWQSSTSESEIRISDYNAIGTMFNAISNHSDKIFNGFSNEKYRKGTELIFKALIKSRSGETGVLQPVSFADILKITNQPEALALDVIDAFRNDNSFILTPGQDVQIANDTVIDLSLESITDLWVQLKKWVAEEVDSSITYKKISSTSARYQTGKAGLLTGPELQLGLQWRKTQNPTLGWANKYDPFYERAITFLEYSEREHQLVLNSKEKSQQSARKRNNFLAVLGLLITVGAIVAAISFLTISEGAKVDRKEAIEERTAAMKSEKKALNTGKEAASQKIYAKFLQTLAEDQKEIAINAKVDAIEARERADSLTRVAIKLQTEAIKAKDEANNTRDEANIARDDAEMATTEAKKAYADLDASQKKAKKLEKDKIDRLKSSNLALKAMQSYAEDKFKAGLDSAKVAFEIIDNISDIPAFDAGVWKALIMGNYHIDRLSIEADNPLERVQRAPGNLRLAYISIGGFGYIHNIAKDEEPQPLNTTPRPFNEEAPLTALYFQDAENLWVGDSLGNLHLMNLSTKEWESSYDSTDSLGKVRAFIPLGKDTLIAVTAHGLAIISNKENSKIKVIECLWPDDMLPVNGAVLSEDSNTMYAFAGTVVYAVDMGNIPSLKVKYTNEFDAIITSVGLLKGRDYGLAGDKDGYLHFFDLTNGRTLGNKTNRHESHISTIQFMEINNQEMILTTGYDHVFKLSKLKPGRPSLSSPLIIAEHTGWITDAAWDKESKTLTTASNDRRIKTWLLSPLKIIEKIQ